KNGEKKESSIKKYLKNIYYVYSGDVVQGFRSLTEDFLKHKILMLFFFIINLAAFYMALRLVKSFIDQNLGLVSSNDLKIIFFLLMTGRVSISTYHEFLRNRQISNLITIPISISEVLWGKFLYMLLTTIGITEVFIIITTVLNQMPRLRIFIPFHFVLDLFLLSAAAVCIGFVFSILSSFVPLWRRLVAMALYGQLLTAVYVIYSKLSISWQMRSSLILLITLIAFVSVGYSFRYFLDCWNLETYTYFKTGRRPLVLFLFKPLLSILNNETAHLLEKEIVINIRKRETVATLVTITMLSFLLVFMYYNMEIVITQSKRYVEGTMEFILAIGIYLAAILGCSMPALGFISKEGKSYWILRTLPLDETRILFTKLAANLLLNFPAVFLISLPVPILSGYPAYKLIFFPLITMAVFLSCSAVGLYFGVFFPNFDETKEGAPSLIIMYVSTIFCFIYSVILMSIAFTLFLKVWYIGVIVSVIEIDLGFIAIAFVMKFSKYRLRYVGDPEIRLSS
ncbi:MAG: hypothetical protein QW728_05525, partial [Thermoplasmata archaeon]